MSAESFFEPPIYSVLHMYYFFTGHLRSVIIQRVSDIRTFYKGLKNCGFFIEGKLELQHSCNNNYHTFLELEEVLLLKVNVNEFA